MRSRILPLLRVFLRMAIYCVAKGVVIGITLAIASSERVGITQLFVDYVRGYALLGGMLGIAYGAVALVVAMVFGNSPNPARLKKAMALVLAVTASPLAVSALINLTQDQSGDATPLLAFSTLHMLVVVWFGHIVARKYISEISPRKQKQKPV